MRKLESLTAKRAFRGAVSRSNFPVCAGGLADWKEWACVRACVGGRAELRREGRSAAGRRTDGMRKAGRTGVHAGGGRRLTAGRACGRTGRGSGRADGRCADGWTACRRLTESGRFTDGRRTDGRCACTDGWPGQRVSCRWPGCCGRQRDRLWISRPRHARNRTFGGYVRPHRPDRFPPDAAGRIP